MPALDMRSLIRRFNEDKAKVGVGAFIRMQDGDNRMRIVTFKDAHGQEQVYAQFRTHFLEDVGQVKCTKSTGGSCPVCEYVSDLRREKMDKVAKQLQAKTRFYFNAIQGDEVRTLECGPTVWQGIMTYFADEEYGNIADVKTGRDIKIIKSGSGIETEYNVLVAPKPTSVKLPAEPKDLTLLLEDRTPEELEETLFAHYERLGNAPAKEEEKRPDLSKMGKGLPGEKEEPSNDDEWLDSTFGAKNVEKVAPAKAQPKKPAPRTKR